MWWIIFAFIPVFIDSLSNIFDSFLCNKYFKNPIILVFGMAVLEVCFLPLLFLYQLPKLIDLTTVGIFVILGLLEAFYIVFYLKALQKDDTSIVTSLFSIGKIFVPIFAFFLIGERLNLYQYAGFFIIIISSIFLTSDKINGKFHLNKSFFYMIISSLLHSIEGVLYKFVLVSVDWVTGITYLNIFVLVSMSGVVLISRKSLIGGFSALRKNIKLISTNSMLGFVSMIAGTIAISLAPITLVKGIWGTQPLIVLIYAFILKKYFPTIIKEKIDKKSLLKKIFFFLLILLSLTLILR